METTVTFRFAAEKVKRLRQVASREEKSLSELIRESLDQKLAEEENRGKSNLERLAYLIGSCKGGPRTDVTKMDLGDILEEKYRAGHL